MLSYTEHGKFRAPIQAPDLPRRQIMRPFRVRIGSWQVLKRNGFKASNAQAVELDIELNWAPATFLG
jgi:hypothetical protein